MGCVDDQGRLFVGDSAGVNWSPKKFEAVLPNRVLMLEDRDGDGVFERSTVFADKLAVPKGGCWADGSLFVASPPGIWKFTDADDDGVAEKRDADGNSTVNFFDRMQNGSSGDFVILVYYSDPYFDARFYDGNATNNPTISSGVVNRIVGYWVAPNRRLAGENAIYSFDTDKYKTGAATWTTSWSVTFPATLSSTVTIESLLPPATVAYSQAAEFPILINDLSGLSNNYTFYNYQNKSIITRCKILHGNQAKRITNTYNFTITPRG